VNIPTPCKIWFRMRVGIILHIPGIILYIPGILQCPVKCGSGQASE